MHVAALLLRVLLDDTVGDDVVGQPLEQVEPELRAGLLPAPEHDGDLHLVTAAEEADDVTLLGLVVVLVDLGTELHLLDDGVGLVASGLAGLLGVLVLELAVVHELADGRARGRRDLDEVEIVLAGELHRLLDADDADLLAVGPDQADLGDADALVDAQFVADCVLQCVTVGTGARERPPPAGGGLVMTRPDADGDDVPPGRTARRPALELTRRAAAAGWEIGPPLAC